MRSSVNAVLSFGVVNVPVGVASAVSEKEAIKFRTLHGKCGTPINQKMICVTCNADLTSEDTVRGYEYAKSQFVTLTDDEFDRLKLDRSKVIVINKFVPENSIASAWFNKDYWLIPNKVLGASYGVLHGGIISTGLWGFGSATLWGKEHPCVVRATSDALVLTLLHTPEMMVEPDFDVPSPSAEELKIVGQLLTMMKGDVTQEDLVASDEQAMRATLAALISGTELPEAHMEKAPDPSNDVIEAMRASIAAQKKPKRQRVRA